MFLLDTNTIIEYLKGSLPTGGMQMVDSIADDKPAMSVITKIELLGFKAPDEKEEELAVAFAEGSLILNLSDAIVNQAINLRRNYKIKLTRRSNCYHCISK